MSFTLSPSTVAPTATFTAAGTGAKKRKTRIRVSKDDPVMANAILAEFAMPASGKFSRLISAPGGPARPVTLVLQQVRADGVWAQTADVKLILVGGGSGGGTTPLPPNVPPVPPPDITPPTISNVVISAITTSGATISWTTSEAATGVVRHGVEATLAGASTTSATSSGTSHNRSVTSYPPNIRVYFQVVATDTAGNVRQDSIRSFLTNAVIIPPGPEPPGTVVEVSTAAQFITAANNTNIDTVMMNDGTYQPGSDIAANYYLPPPARTADNPLLVQAVNVPADPSDPHGVIWTSRMYFRNRRGSYTTWNGISFEGISVGDTGIVVFGAYGEPGPDHVTFLNTRFVDNTPLNQSTSHHWYLSDGNSHHITIDGYYAEGVNRSGFTGFHAYHSPLGDTITVKNGVIRKCYAGMLMWGQNTSAPWSLTNFLAEDMDIQDVGFAVDIRRVQGTLRRVDASNIGPGTSAIRSGSITLDDCSGIPAPVP